MLVSGISYLLVFFFGCIGIQLFFLLHIFSKINRSLGTRIDPLSVTPSETTATTELNLNFSVGVSVVVCAWNEEKNLRELIPLLLNQAYTNFEVIIVDDRSDTACYHYLLLETLRQEKLRLVRIDQTPPHSTAKKHALTLGIEAARHDLILLTDADCRPVSNQWIREMQRSMTHNKEIVLGFSPYQVKTGFLNFFIRYETFYTAVQYLSFALSGFPYMGVGRNLMYKKSLFFKHKGFLSHQHVLGGDDDLFIGQSATPHNVSVCLQPEAFMVSIPKTTVLDWFRQKKRHLSVGKHYKWENKFLLGLLALSQIGVWITWIPLLILGSAPIVWLASATFVFRMIVLTIVLNRIHKKLDASFNWYYLPLFDLLYIIYYLFTGVSAFFSKKIQWT